VLDPDSAARLREMIAATGFPLVSSQHEEVLSSPLPRRARRPLFMRLARREDLDAKTALVIALGEQLPIPLAVLGDELGAALCAVGLLEPLADEPGWASSRLSLANLEGALVIADAFRVSEDTVMAPGPGTAALAALMPDVKGKRVLDLCAGPGSIAAVAAMRGGDVVATDLSERCVAFMRANALLNGVDLDIRLGDLFEPVKGERFDVVLSHPPYIEQPDDVEAVMFMHGGERGDELPYVVLEGMSDVLAPGGQALVEFHATGTPEDVGDRVHTICRTRGCDLVLVGRPVQDADSRAVSSAFMHDPDFGDEFNEAAIRYRDHLDRIGHEGTAAIAYLRRPSDESREPWATLLSSPRLPRTWESLARYVEGIDVLARGEGAIEGAKVRAPAGGTLVVEMPLSDGERTPGYSLSLPPASFAADRGLEPGAAQLLDVLCRSATVGDAIATFAAESGGEPEALRDNVLAFVRENVVRGALVIEP